jgi:hypothetical protein
LQVCLYLNTPPGSLAMNQAENLADDFIQVERDVFNSRPLEKRTYAPHNFSGILYGANSPLARRDSFGHIWGLRGQPSNADLGIRQRGR